MNMLSGAKYLKDGHPVMDDKDGGLMESVEPMNFLPGFHLEGYPNRDSTIYGDLYGIREAHTLLRGTLRYAGILILILYFHEKRIYILLQKNEVLWF